MKVSLLIAILALLAFLLAFNQAAGASTQVGGLPWQGWAVTVVITAVLGGVFAWVGAERARRLLNAPPTPKQLAAQKRVEEARKRRKQFDPQGPDYPHPFIVVDNCIACGACVEACPHDVLAMMKEGKKGFAKVVRRDLCMEDTTCETVCPVNPKACIVINTTRKIKTLPAPTRNTKTLMTNVAGCYVIGDVSGTPLIKNAANEGRSVVKQIADELRGVPRPAGVELDVVVVGMGPGGLSAIIEAHEAKTLAFLGLEQDTVLATIESYPQEKYVNFKPDSQPAETALPFAGAGSQREEILDECGELLEARGVPVYKNDPNKPGETGPPNSIHVFESCEGVERVGDDHFLVRTGKAQYHTRRVVIAIGLRGTPMTLGRPDKPLKNEEIEIERAGQRGRKVMYKLRNPAAYEGFNIIVVGGGNSAVETAVDLVADRKGDEITFRPPERSNKVKLLIRSDFTKDVKFGNKRHIYKCIDEGKVELCLGVQVKEIHDGEVVIEHSKTKRVERVPNDYVFAMIGGERPDAFLRKIGIEVPKGE
ncbi:MAG TPA: NAD(P)-binding domain-containing protein [Pyrinomonadaceae bacterium]|jgi:thioredoxin reductase/NAD-dependent dihydropyrimidine dehydrogenase PreA subunit